MRTYVTTGAVTRMLAVACHCCKLMVDSNILYSPRWLLKQEVPKIVKSINRLLREKSIKTKVGLFVLLYFGHFTSTLRMFLILFFIGLP